MEVEAVDDGKSTKILVPAGTENVRVNAPIALIQSEDDAEAAKTTVAADKAAPSGKGTVGKLAQSEKLSDELEAPPTEQARDEPRAQPRAALTRAGNRARHGDGQPVDA